jgi:hypothetical protein
MPTALRWSPTRLYVTYDGATRPYLFNTTETDLLGGLQGELAALEAAAGPDRECTNCLFSREWSTVDETVAYLREQGITAKAMDQDRLEVEMPFASRSMERSAVTRLILNIRDRRFERSTLLIDGLEASSHDWGAAAQAGFPASSTFTIQGKAR